MDVLAPTAGRVFQHAVSVGQEVVEGTDILTFEVMKLEMPIAAPCSGIVTWLCLMDTPVNDGDVLAIIEPPV